MLGETSSAQAASRRHGPCAGHAISNSESIRRAHNSFRPPNPIVSDEKAESSKDDEAYHFIAYVPNQGTLYELDGLKAGPIDLCSCTEVKSCNLQSIGNRILGLPLHVLKVSGNLQEDWLELVQPFIQQRIERYSASEIRFNLMALIRDRRDVLRDKLSRLQQQGDAEASGQAERQHEIVARIQE